METTDKYTEYAEQCIDNILDTLEKVEPNKITVVTGDNATGKSVLRQLVWKPISKALGKQIKVADISMQRRTGLHSELGGGGVFLRDTDWSATSTNTLSFIKSVLGATERYIVLDEPEIGMSVSLQASVGEYLNKILPEVLEKNYGIMIITHSHELIKRLSCCDVFLNLQGKSKEEYLTAEPEIIDLEEFEKRDNALFKALQNQLK